MREILLTQGNHALIDDEDYELVSKYKWRARKGHGTFYAVYNCRRIGDKRKTLRMHRIILKAGSGQKVDHVNGNGLDNRRSNLRFATNSQNQANRQIGCRNTSGFKGVFWERSHGKWRSQIQIKGRPIHLGYFTCKEEAAKAYDQAARKYFKDFAQTNF